MGALAEIVHSIRKSPARDHGLKCIAASNGDVRGGYFAFRPQQFGRSKAENQAAADARRCRVTGSVNHCASKQCRINGGDLSEGKIKRTSVRSLLRSQVLFCTLVCAPQTDPLSRNARCGLGPLFGRSMTSRTSCLADLLLDRRVRILVVWAAAMNSISASDQSSAGHVTRVDVHRDARCRSPNW